MTLVETPEHQLLRRSVAELASRYGSAYMIEQARSGGRTVDLWDEAGRAGYLGVNVPAEYGGGGAGIYELQIVCEELAAGGCPLLLIVVSPAICATVIAKFGTPDQRSAWLPRFAEPAERLAAGSLVAPMPGAVLRVAVREGDQVAAGQLLFTLEAMKMEHPVRAPGAGTVTAVRVTEGTQVQAGAVLAVLVDRSEPDSPPDQP